MTARAEIVVDLAAIRHNVRLLKELVGTRYMAVVKADGYGHGLAESARAAREGGRGLARRGHHRRGRGPASGRRRRTRAVLAHRPGRRLAGGGRAGRRRHRLLRGRARRGAARPASRPGCRSSWTPGCTAVAHRSGSWDALFARAHDAQRDGRVVVTGIWSHFSSSDEPADPANDEQERLFDEGLRRRACHRSRARGHATWPTRPRPSSGRAAGCDLVRVRHRVVRPRPRAGRDAARSRPAAGDDVRRPAWPWSSTIATGGAVSYGRTWVADHDTTLGLVPGGLRRRHARACGGNRAEV